MLSSIRMCVANLVGISHIGYSGIYRLNNLTSVCLEAEGIQLILYLLFKIHRSFLLLALNLHSSSGYFSLVRLNNQYHGFFSLQYSVVR